MCEMSIQTLLFQQRLLGRYSDMHHTMVQEKSVSWKVLGTSVIRVETPINLMSCEGTSGHVVSGKMDSSLDVPGPLGVLDVFSNDECTLQVAKKGNGQWCVRVVSI